jgi:catechol 2,3-dioxygenase-like lactoylglutathione lyase family enzyme
MHPFESIDHVQLAMPRGRENDARAFYCGVLEMQELPKPVELAKRGGCWFASGLVQLHLGVEDDFRPAKKAHPGVVCRDFDALIRSLRDRDIEVREDGATDRRRAFVDDPFGNRIELIEASL